MLILNTQKLNQNQHSTLRTAHVCAYHYAQLSYTTQHGTVLIILPLILQTIIIPQMMHTGGEREQQGYNSLLRLS